MPDFQYMNLQQKIEHYEGILGKDHREVFMNDDAYLAKLVSLTESKPIPKKPLFGKKKKK